MKYLTRSAVVLLGLLSTAAMAQFGLPPKADLPTAAPKTPMEVITRLLQQDIFIQPGVGLKKVYLGLSFEQVLKIWGKPKDTRRGTLFGAGQDWLYQGEDGTQIILSGGKTVESMSLRGTITSNFQTTEGARFGMAQYEIASLYGQPKKSAKNGEMHYKGRGILFAFAAGRMRTLHVVKRTR